MRCGTMWKRAASAVAGLVFGAPVLVGAYATFTINKKRYRYFADDYTLTPEHLGMTYHSVEICTSDNVKLNGWFIPKSKYGKPVSRVVIICHPRNSHKSNMLAMAKEIFDHGYSIFMFDFRSFAETPTRQTIGHLEQRDARAALDFMLSYQHMKPQGPLGTLGGDAVAEEEIDIVLVGGSLGGAMSLMLSNHPRVQAVVADCAYSSLPNAVRFVVRRGIVDLCPFDMPEVVMEPLLDASVEVTRFMTGMVYDYDINNISPMEEVAQLTDTPLLLIHSKDDSYVPVFNVYNIYNSATQLPESHKSIKIVPGDHLSGYFQDPDYIKDITKFLDEALLLRKQTKRASNHPPSPSPPPLSFAHNTNPSSNIGIDKA